MKVLKAIIETINNWNGKTKNGQLEEADAIILEFHLTGYERNGEVETRLLLQVVPKYGRNYVTEYLRYISEGEIQFLCSGNRIKVFHQRTNPLKIMDMVIG